MEKGISVLQVTSGFRKGVSGGIPSVLYNYCTSSVFTDGEINFDYLALGYQTFEPYRKEFEAGGSKLFCLDIHENGIKRLCNIYIRLKEFISSNNYDVIHINSGALMQVLVCCIAAKHSGCKIIIAHSHNSIKKEGLRGVVYNCLKLLFKRYATDWYACSEMAAKSMFPSSIIDNNKWTLIPNAIDLDKFAYNQKIRLKYRKKFDIENKYVIGNVGRFNEQKNHIFLLQVFAEVVKLRCDAVLLLVGTGDLLEYIRAEAKKLNVYEKVIFTGQRQDVNCIMQAMDVLAFPSIFEGLGMALIEAQASGMHVISSNTVPICETKITSLIEYLPLEHELWVSRLAKICCNENRNSPIKELETAGYGLGIAAQKLKSLYTHAQKRNK